MANTGFVGWRKKVRTVEDHAGAVDTAPAVPAEPENETNLLATVTAELSDSESGIDFVYRSLDRMQQRSGSDELVVIVDDGPLGRQAFAAGRRPIESPWARELVRSGAPGVHASPPVVDGAVASSVAQLCSLALRLDVARHDSLHDPLTGLLNRRAFDEVLANSCAQSERYQWPFALVLLDLDAFKEVNDRLGHAAGDVTLQTVGAELRQRLRVGDAAARIGGDEFALILPNVREGVVAELVERLESAIERAVPDAKVTLSAGHAVAPDDGHRPTELSRVADARLYEGKRR